MNHIARCNREHALKKDVPVASRAEDFSKYDVVYIGFPIWYGCAPNVVNTFCSDLFVSFCQTKYEHQRENDDTGG